MVEQKTQTLAAKRRWGAKTNIYGCRLAVGEVVSCSLRIEVSFLLHYGDGVQEERYRM